MEAHSVILSLGEILQRSPSGREAAHYRTTPLLPCYAAISFDGITGEKSFLKVNCYKKG
jgi:hypothetical protein